MAELAPQESQPTQQPAQPAQEQQFEPQVPIDSDEDIMGRVMGERPRDDKGRFVAEQPAAEQPPAQEQTAEAPAEPEKPQAAQEEYKWDDLKAIKLKIPMKQGDKEWEDEISLEQLREERMLKADYTRKSQELAEHRKQVEVHTRTEVEKERSAYLQTLDTLHKSIIQAASPELANVDWNKLSQENPAEYVRLSNRAREVNSALERVRFEQEKVQTQQAKERDERLAQAVSESKTKLLEAIPNWSDDLYTALQKRGTDTYGFKQDEIGQVWDHRVMQVLHDAHQFRLLKEKQPASGANVQKLPPVLKPGAQKPKVDTQQQELQRTKERLRQNGNDSEAAADLMGAFITPRR